ncbi:MAG TPA: AsmA family protein, partial [Acetobacteraceae bacterium]
MKDMVDPDDDSPVTGGLDTHLQNGPPGPVRKPERQQRRRWPFVLTGAVLVAGILATVWDWDWFRPLVEHEASAALGRSVTLHHFDLRLGRQTVVVADGVRVANPEGFPQDVPLAIVDKLTVTIDTIEWLRHRILVVPDILIEQPRIAATQREDGSTNYLLPVASPGASGSAARLGNLRIIGGQAHVVLDRLRADFRVTIETRDTADTPEVVAEAKGTYARQPIEASFVGGALLSLRDAAIPYHLNLKLANGATRATLIGSVQDPLNFAGTNLKLELAGTDMELLLPLIGIAFPKTPSYRIKGDLDYADGQIHFRNFSGQLGSSDVEGNIAVEPGPKRPVVTADVTSRQVDLADLGGFL